MNTAEDTLSAILACYPQKEQQEQILRAYRIADDAMKDKLRENRHPFIEHPFGVARIVAEDIHLGYESVIAVFLHETIRFYPEVTQSLPKGAFSPEIIDIAQSLNKIAAIKPKETRLEAENYKRLIVSYSRDPRVMLIKIADRLDVMRNIELLPKTSQERKVTETMFLYIPIAHQLGLYGIKTELENIFFRCTEPEKYREINNKLKATAAEREELLNAFLIPIKRKLSEAGIKVTYKQRTKAPWSIWKKMQKQDIPFEKVMDLLAVRLIIDTPADSLEKEHELCWKAYSIVTDEYRPDTSRLRDWISKPKSSGYESLHITVQFRGDIFVEVQIRTRRMDDEAENGHASHWAYKGIKEEKGLTPWLQSVRNILESDNRNDYEYVSRFLSEDVFVFTPDGELRRLPKGATVLDFAFNIHTNLGLKCVGATIDGRPASIKDRLSTGQVVEIKSGKNQRPSPDWLNFVVTSKARNKIKLKLKEEELKKAATGRELLERRLKNWKMELPDEDLTILCKKYKLKTISDFYAAIADEKVDIMDVKSYISRKQQGEEEAAAIPSSQTPKDNGGNKEAARDSSTDDYLVIDGKLSNVSYKMARCCNPIYGDEVFGFVSVKDGIKIHRMSCPNAARLIENYPYRIQKVRWKETSTTSSFQTTVKVITDDSAAYSSVIKTVTDFGASLRSSSMTPRAGRSAGEFDIRMQIFVSSNSVLDKIISAIRKTRGVLSAVRISK
jgi:guanosine-3',5'-bis(diphosphate) 3'-pyrophosphohydrolase